MRQVISLFLLLAALAAMISGCRCDDISIQPIQPSISSITPSSGVRGLDQVVIRGLGFGDGALGKVYFTALAGRVPSQVPVVEAVVATETIGGVETRRWSDTEITVYVPGLAASGEVYLLAEGRISNKFTFTVLEPAPGTVLITGFSPTSGPVGTAVTIDGENFGAEQGSSMARLGTLELGITSWSDTQISGLVPAGAVSGKFHVTVGAQTADSQADFIVGEAPVVTGVTPELLRIGQPVTVYGQSFGATQGSGTLRIGTTQVTPTAWSDSRIDVAELPACSYPDPTAVPLQVTNDSGMASPEYQVAFFESSLSGTLAVEPATGVAESSSGAADGTPFVFTAAVSGGTGPYLLSLIPDRAHPDELQPATTNPTLTYYYPEAGTFETAVQVRDTANGDVAVIDGPSVTVLANDTVLISAINLLEFPGPVAAPNAWCYTEDAAAAVLYSDLTFTEQGPVLTSALTDVVVTGGGTTDITRDWASYLDGGSNSRSLGFRQRGTEQGTVVIRGANFGADQGSIWLDSSGVDDGLKLLTGNIVSWADQEIVFLLPVGELSDLSGPLTVETAAGAAATSDQVLVCSPYITVITPAQPIHPSATLELTGFDLTPPSGVEWIGDQTYLFWVINAEYTDPWTSTPMTGKALIVKAFPVVIETGGVVHFDLTLLSGDQEVEVFNPASPPYTAGQLVTATAVPGEYACFLWTGALASGTDAARANSGVFSEAFTLNISSSQLYSIAGHVQSSNGSPLAGVTISVNPGSLIATTDSNGDYLVDNLPAGEYYLAAQLSEWSFQPMTRTAVIPPDSIGNDFTGLQGAELITISGHIQIITQENPPPSPPVFAPVSGATLAIYAGDVYPPTAPVLDVAFSDANGNYVLSVPKGDLMTWYTIVATHPSYPDPSEWLTFWTVVQGADSGTANPLTVKKH